MAKNEKRIALALLNLDYQTRAETDEGTGREYAELPADTFPPVVVYCIDDKYYLADGFHRVLAAKLRGENHIKAELRSGTVEDVILYGGTANNKQGKRPTRDDTQHFMRMVWERREAIFGGTPTGGNMAERCGVSANTGLAFVRERLAELPSSPAQIAEVSGTQATAPVRPSRLIGADGKSYPVRPVRAPLPTAPVRPSAPVVTAAAPVVAAPAAPVRLAHVVPTDCFGVEIPVQLQPAFDGVDISRDIAKGLRDGLHKFKEAVRQQAPFVAIYKQPQAVQMDIEKALGWFIKRNAEPFCVCPSCQGQGCKVCRNIGWLTRFGYDKALPSDLKAAYNLPMTAAEAAATDDESEVQA